MIGELWPRGGEFMTNWKPLPDAKQRLLVSTAMLGALCVGYGRRAYAACVASPVGTYVCSGALTTTQSFSPGVPLSVSTASGFSITTTAGPAFNLTSSGVGSFTDSNSSTITGFTNGIYMEGATGSSPITITTTGDVTGQAGWGIAGRTFGGNLTINANEVNGTTYGVIGTMSGGSGTLSITTTGAVVEASPSGLGNFAGIRAYNNGTGDTNIQTQAVTGVINGIYAKAGANAGGITITSNGLVTSQRYGVHTYTTGAGVSVKAPGGIQSGDAGVYIKSLGTGNTSGAIYVNAGQITVSGGTAGANRDGIYVEGAGRTTGVTIKSAGVTTTYGGQHTTATGISVLQGPNFSNVTSTGISITTTGAISAQGEYGDIFVKNEANGNVTINAGAALTATNSSRYIANGVTVSNTGTGGVSITTSTINVGGYGVEAYNSARGRPLDHDGPGHGRVGRHQGKQLHLRRERKRRHIYQRQRRRDDDGQCRHLRPLQPAHHRWHRRRDHDQGRRRQRRGLWHPRQEFFHDRRSQHHLDGHARQPPAGFSADTSGRLCL